MNSVQRQNHKSINNAKDMVVLALIAGEPDMAYEFTKELVKKVKKLYKVGN